MDKIIPITENGERKLYVTNAPYEVITQCLDECYTKMEFNARIIENGYNIKEHFSTISINFDEM